MKSRKKSIFYLFVIFLIPGLLFAGDLCLIKINNTDQLDNARKIIGYAKGMIDDRFIVEIEPEQMSELQKTGIRPELLGSGISIDRLYYVESTPKSFGKTPIALDPIYQFDNQSLVTLSTGDPLILARSGYYIEKLGQRQIPFFYNPPTAPGPVPADIPTDTLADLVVLDSIYSYDFRLQEFETRLSTTDSNTAAMEWIEAKFESFGYTNVYHDFFTASRDDFDIPEHIASNAICVKPGSEQPDRLIVIGAHYDSINLDRPDCGFYYAPGADDNASGVACVLELARLMKDFDNKKTLMFVAFGAEELGLIGARHLAGTLYDDSTDIEVMVNLDMVGNVDDTDPDIDLGLHNGPAYWQVASDIIDRLTDQYAHKNSGGGSDHVAFRELGYNAVAFEEGDFNYFGWHTNFDLVQYLDFEYMTKIAKSMVASVAYFDQAEDPVEFEIYDVGDGQSLQVSWDDCHPDYSYIITYGTQTYNMDDTIFVPAGECHYDITGLAEGQLYYVGLYALANEGVPQVPTIIHEAAPFSAPAVPDDFSANPDSNSIIINWNPNRELDFDHYKVLRMEEADGWTEYMSPYFDTVLVDYDVTPHTNYRYILIAVDTDGIESDSTESALGVPATFDGGILFAEETQSGGINPTQSEQASYYGAILDTFPGNLSSITTALNRNTAGQYNPIFWVDDDDSEHVFEESLDSILWYMDYGTDFLLAGWESIIGNTGQSYFYDGSFYHDQLGISFVGENVLTDFIGAAGENDWPDLELKPDAPYGARLPDIQIFTPVDNAEVIYRYISNSQQPYYHDKPVGVVYDTHHGKRVTLGFPIYWLTEESARALIERVMVYYNEPSPGVNGDLNGDWAVNILDITYLINYLYLDGSPPVELNNADVNQDCMINLLDITYLIAYLYQGGSIPLEGCIE